MENLRPFISKLNNTVKNAIRLYPDNKREIENFLNGRPANELRKLISLQDLRKVGAFFTGNELIKFAISEKFSSSINKDFKIADPACGNGDLLLACTPYLPLGQDLPETINLWQNNLLGIDLHSEFIEIAKLRLILKAILLGVNIPDNPLPKLPNIFNGLKVGSFFDNLDILHEATHIFINPPYYIMAPPESYELGNGKTNAAAIFLWTCINHVQNGTRIIAILPDVLRSGTRYEKWRNFVEENTEILNVNLYGQFDAWTDVDVFVLELIVNNGTRSSFTNWVNTQSKVKTTISDKFDLSTGPVVDYRDPNEGPTVKFIKPKGLETWKTVTSISSTRQFKGRTHNSPFVVVRRTSRIGDLFRAVGTIINVDQPIAVENHLIILLPKDGRIETCEKLLTILKDERTNKWINEAIRCRHLTIKSLADLPWWSE